MDQSTWEGRHRRGPCTSCTILRSETVLESETDNEAKTNRYMRQTDMIVDLSLEFISVIILDIASGFGLRICKKNTFLPLLKHHVILFFMNK